MIEIRDKNIVIQEGDIRQLYDQVGKKWYFSIVDVVAKVAHTTDARNYWKVLKNRLKKGQNKLVTQCNQLKMKATDGKSYLTDAGDKNTILGIIEEIDPDYVDVFETYFNKISRSTSLYHATEGGELSTVLNESEEKTENEIPLDVYQKGEYVFVEAFVGAVNPDHLHIELGYEKIKIKGKRIKDIKNQSAEYINEELIWGNFERIFNFPVMLDINEYEATLSRGHLKIKIKKLDREKIKEVRIKSI